MSRFTTYIQAVVVCHFGLHKCSFFTLCCQNTRYILLSQIYTEQQVARFTWNILAHVLLSLWAQNKA